MISVRGFCQDLTIKQSTFDNIMREVEKCDSLKVRYNELLKNITDLQDKIQVSTARIEELRQDKASLRTEIDGIKVDYDAERKKRFNLSVQIGAMPIIDNNDFSVQPYFGLGLGYTIFRF